ncbi:MAG TPA: wax ester/triacylglycerol synthase family O-acyltransferase [Solirubrobacteraceae bacterium]|nr:wax ester/triacylglycerol synthase family O-acyltransferase [Solirubrobacteraceae bacterium]
MTRQRLSALDASFLAVETPTAHMHIGWVALFSPADGRLPSFAELRDHIELRLGHAPRYRHKLASVPLGVQAPEWVDDPCFSIDRHVYWAPGSLEKLIDETMSIPLRRDRPLWEMWICHDAAHMRFAIVGKTHHCMVDGLAALELASLLLDPTPEPVAYERAQWQAEPEPRGERMLARGLRDLVDGNLDLLQWPLRLAGAPGPVAQQTTRGALRALRVVDQLLRPAPPSVLNEPLSRLRRLTWVQRPLEDLRTIRRAYGTTVNDVILAAVAGGIRAYLLRRGEEPVALKVMVPVSVRGGGEGVGNHISFVFAELPCHEPDPLARLYEVHASMTRCKREGEPEGSDLVLKAASRVPATVQQALSRLFASPRAFNLVVSNIPGPTAPMYMLGCQLQAIYPMVPLSDHHALSVGMVSVGGQACFGVYADREALPDVELLARDIDEAVDELLAGTYRMATQGGSLLARARAAAEPGYAPLSHRQRITDPSAPAPGITDPPAPTQRIAGPAANDAHSNAPDVNHAPDITDLAANGPRPRAPGVTEPVAANPRPASEAAAREVHAPPALANPVAAASSPEGELAQLERRRYALELERLADGLPPDDGVPPARANTLLGDPDAGAQRPGDEPAPGGEPAPVEADEGAWRREREQRERDGRS